MVYTVGAKSAFAVKNKQPFMIRKTSSISASSKASTGIEGFDEITRGGLARGRTTLLAGGPGSGKSLLALQVLVNGARIYDEPGIFVAFEENSKQIIGNAGKFGWDLPALQRKNLFFLNAQPTAELIQSGAFDLDGLLAVLAAKADEMGAKRIVFDAIDVLLSLLDDKKTERREICKLHEWLLARGLTAIITAKADGDAENERHLSFIQFMVDCAIDLNHTIVSGVSQRNLRVLKYRGSAFEENESPFVIGDQGLEVAGSNYTGESRIIVSNERVSSGVPRLDTMLGGGYYRGSSVLITGFPGTAKSTLCGAFAEAAGKRGERTLYVSFDSDMNEVIRNLASVNIRLQRFVKSGRLFTKSARAINGSAEIHLMRIKKLVREHKVRCLVIDPVSALAKSGNEGAANGVAERLIDWAKLEGITMLCTSLLDSNSLTNAEGTPIQISTLADTWIHLSYLVNAGERNRGLSIIKSRGTAHSNQVRELILSDKGVTLADAYMAGGEVLMGTLRWEKELAARNAQTEAANASQRQRMKIISEEAELTGRIKSLQVELEMKRAEKNLAAKSADGGAAQLSQNEKLLRKLRKADSNNQKGNSTK
jgi:circadian clock protein KaiC